MNNEPKILSSGKEFHKKIQKEWIEGKIDGIAKEEKVLKRKIGRIGRMDILVEEIGDYISVIEIKNTDWQRIKKENLRKNIKRMIRQIWSYIETYVDNKVDVCPGIIFPLIPKKKELLQIIENEFNNDGIQVVWHNETIDECRKRNSKNK